MQAPFQVEIAIYDRFVPSISDLLLVFPIFDALLSSDQRQSTLLEEHPSELEPLADPFLFELLTAS